MSEHQLLMINEAISNAMNALVFAQTCEEENEKTGYLQCAMKILSWATMDIVSLRRERLLR